MKQFNKSAFIVNTASSWLLKAGLVILGVTIMAPPESLARVSFDWIGQNPAVAMLIFIAITAAAVYVAYLRSKTLRIDVTKDVIRFQVGHLVRKNQWIKLADIRNIKSNANLIEQKFGAATLSLETVGTGGVDMTLPQLNAEEAEHLRQLWSPRGNDPQEQTQAA